VSHREDCKGCKLQEESKGNILYPYTYPPVNPTVEQIEFNKLSWKGNEMYSLRPIILFFANIDVFRHILVVNTSILARVIWVGGSKNLCHQTRAEQETTWNKLMSMSTWQTAAYYFEANFRHNSQTLTSQKASTSNISNLKSWGTTYISSEL
jgi:hypothetical protein